jgi:PAS domain S-box-containing protein
VEANRSLTGQLGYSAKELLNLKLDRLVSQKPQEIHDQLGQIHQDGEAVRMDWRARKKDGSLIDLEIIGSWLEHQGKDQVLLFCREAEGLTQPLAQAQSREQEPSPPPHAAEDSMTIARGMMDDLDNIARDLRAKPARPQPEVKKSPDYTAQFDEEAKKLIKRIEDAMTKVKKIRKTSNHRPNV